MILLHTRKEIISKKELQRRIEVIKQAKHYLETDGRVMWAGEYITNPEELHNKAVECVGRKYAKRLFK